MILTVAVVLPIKDDVGEIDVTLDTHVESADLVSVDEFFSILLTEDNVYQKFRSIKIILQNLISTCMLDIFYNMRSVFYNNILAISHCSLILLYTGT